MDTGRRGGWRSTVQRRSHQGPSVSQFPCVFHHKIKVSITVNGSADTHVVVFKLVSRDLKGVKQRKYRVPVWRQSSAHMQATGQADGVQGTTGRQINTHCSLGMTKKKKYEKTLKKNQHPRELISTWKMSHTSTTKTWVACSNSHLACE